MTHVIDAQGRIKRTTGIVGAGVAGQVAYWSAATVLAGDAGMTYDPATDTLTVGVITITENADTILMVQVFS